MLNTVTAETLVAAISAERPRKHPDKRKFTDAQLRAAVEKFDGDTRAIAEALRASIGHVNRARAKLGISRKIFWRAENRQRLISLATQSPRPSNEALALEFGTTTNAITTALSRLSITVAGRGREGRKPRDLSALLKRKCMTCERPYVAEHRHNHICRPCTEQIAGMAA